MLYQIQNTRRFVIGEVFTESLVGCRDVSTGEFFYVPRGTLVEASADELPKKENIPFNVYNICEGKAFGNPDDCFEIKRLVGNRVVYQDLNTDEIKEQFIDQLVADWTEKKYEEIKQR